MEMRTNWDVYCDYTQNMSPSKTLVDALELSGATGKALDLGAGGLRDTKHLLGQGFEVVSVDASPRSFELARRLRDERLSPVQTRFEEFLFPRAAFDLINAQFSLPFIRPGHFERVFRRLYDSLKEHSVFVGQFLGEKDSWSPDSEMTFVTWEKIVAVCGPLKIYSFYTEEYDGPTEGGSEKHWHVYHVLAHK